MNLFLVSASSQGLPSLGASANCTLTKRWSCLLACSHPLSMVHIDTPKSPTFYDPWPCGISQQTSRISEAYRTTKVCLPPSDSSARSSSIDVRDELAIVLLRSPQNAQWCFSSSRRVARTAAPFATLKGTTERWRQGSARTGFDCQRLRRRAATARAHACADDKLQAEFKMCARCTCTDVPTTTPPFCTAPPPSTAGGAVQVGAPQGERRTRTWGGLPQLKVRILVRSGLTVCADRVCAVMQGNVGR